MITQYLNTGGRNCGKSIVNACDCLPTLPQHVNENDSGLPSVYMLLA